jgi:hypothetical protein
MKPDSEATDFGSPRYQNLAKRGLRGKKGISKTNGMSVIDGQYEYDDN